MVSQHPDGNKGTCCGRRRPILTNSPRFQTPAPLSSRPILMMLAGGPPGFAIRCQAWRQGKDASVQACVLPDGTGGVTRITARDSHVMPSSSSELD